MLYKKCLILFLSVILNPSFSWAAHKTRILFVSAERSGYFQTGGLAHAVGGLATAFGEEGVIADVAMPFYLQMNKPAQLSYSDVHIEIPLDDYEGQAKRTAEFYVLSKGSPTMGETLFFRHNSSKQNYFDNRNEHGKKFYGPSETLGEAFGAWSKAVSEYILTQQEYDIVLLNDWHSSLVALFLDIARKQGKRVPKVVLAIHNLAFQGVYPKSMMQTLGIPAEYYSVEDGIEFYNQISFLKAGILKSDLVYTVSPNYANEIATPLFGAGLDGLIRRAVSENRLVGVLNGIETAKWDPATRYHEAIQWPFTESDFSGKVTGKAALQNELKLPINNDAPIFILTSRVAEQKGYEYLPQVIEQFLQNNNAQFVIIGDGDQSYINKIEALEKQFPEKVRYQPFSERSEKILKAYGDFFINAAWFEPSGLNQLFALKNGTIPILSRVGGLSNSVEDGASGFLFDIIWKDNQSGYDTELTIQSLVKALGKAFETYKNDPAKILAMRRTGMRKDNSWNSRVNFEFNSIFQKYLQVNISKRTCKESLNSLH